MAGEEGFVRDVKGSSASGGVGLGNGIRRSNINSSGVS